MSNLHPIFQQIFDDMFGGGLVEAPKCRHRWVLEGEDDDGPYGHCFYCHIHSDDVRKP